MYHPKVIERNISQVESELKLTLVRYTIGEVEAWVEHLDKRKKLLEAKLGRPIVTSDLKPEEQAFIRNEILLSAHDFSYWSERYAWLIADPVSGGGLRRFIPWGSQKLVLERIAKMELEQTDAHMRGEPVDGILLALHKARQLGATLLARVLMMHRVTTTPHTRAISASVDEDKVEKLYERDKRILTNLPWWLAPTIGFEEKAKHITWDRLDSSLLYQELVQKAGLGQGEQFDLGHITEVASAPNPGTLEHDYFPTIPQSPYALHIMETTAQGRDNFWRFFIDDIRANNSRWKLVFIPWYAEEQKYRRTPPENWKPDELALLHAQRVWDTSYEYVGKQVMLSLPQLYWWSSTRADYQRKDSLNLFLTNYCATVEESFQHTSASVFDASLLDHFRTQVRDGQAYEFRTGEVA